MALPRHSHRARGSFCINPYAMAAFWTVTLSSTFFCWRLGETGETVVGGLGFAVTFVTFVTRCFCAHPLPCALRVLCVVKKSKKFLAFRACRMAFFS